MKVSVCMITYNHEKFIAQAIESVLMQQVDFDYEIVIGEDCSIDGTRNIVVGFQRKYPGRVRLLLSERNLGMQKNGIQSLQACHGQYVALLEGDDYWTDPHKLQKQVDYLERHLECSLCFHNVIMMWQDGSGEVRPRCRPDQKTQLSIEDVLLANTIPTCSVMFRNGLVCKLPAWYYELIMGDWPLWVLLAQHGSLGYIDEVMGTYRIHSGGIWSGGNYLEQLRGWFEVYEAIDRYLGYRYHSLVEQAKVNYLLAAADEFLGSEGGAISLRQRAQILRTYAEKYTDHDPRLVKRFMGQYYGRCFFEAAQKKDDIMVRRGLPGLVQYNPSLFANRGVLSITARALLGDRIATVLRQCARRVGI